MRKLKYSVLVILIFIISIVVLLVIKHEQDNSSYNTAIETTDNSDEILIYDDKDCFTDEFIEKEFGVKNLTADEKDLMMYYNNNIHEMLLKMLKPGSEWRCFPVSKSIKERYNEKEGILAEFGFDSVDYSDQTKEILNEYGSAGNISVIGTKNQKKKEIFMTISTNRGLESFEIVKTIDLTDENGNELDTRLRCTEENWESILNCLIDNDENRQSMVAVTKSFNSKYKSFTDAIIYKTHENGASYGYKSNDFKNKILKCYWYTKSGDKIVTVKLILDNNEFIDDIEIIDIEEL